MTQKKRAQTRTCQSCQRKGDAGTITYDPRSRWWLCDTCLTRRIEAWRNRPAAER